MKSASILISKQYEDDQITLDDLEFISIQSEAMFGKVYIAKHKKHRHKFYSIKAIRKH